MQSSLLYILRPRGVTRAQHIQDEKILVMNSFYQKRRIVSASVQCFTNY